jgi:TonB-linked SusC/RagA family outer membrane protein
MKKLILYLFTICIGFTQIANAQTITGVVSGAEDGTAIPGVSVQLKGTSTAAITDMDGKYQIEAAGPESVLVFTFIGFVTQEVTVGTQTQLNVSLQIDAETKDEVVVVGYGTQKRTTVTGAITSINSKDITSIAVTTADQALQGRAAGVTITNNGSPGTNATIRIRGMGSMGSNDPLIVIDGVVASGMGNLNPNDIESVQVLKDASTSAVYGSLGSNGVIMITTKKGAAGKVKVDFDSYWGQQWNNNRFDLLNVEQYIAYAKAPDMTGGNPLVVSDPNNAGRLRLAETKWMDEIFKKGMMSNYNLGVSGGNENGAYRISMGYVSTEGIMIGTNYERYNFRSNSEFKIGSRFKVGENIAVSFSKQNPLASSGGRSLIEHSIKMAPYLPVYNPENLGGYQGPHSALDGQDAENPVRIALLNSYETQNYSLIGNIYAEAQIINGLNFKSVIGLEEVRVNDNQFEPMYDDDDQAGGATHFNDRANIRKNWSNYRSLIYTNSLTYKKTFAEKHNLDALGLIEYSTTDRAFANISSRDGISNEVEQLSNTNSSVSSQSDEYLRIGYLGRVNYNYQSKYMLAASMRWDASSRFGNDYRWGSFPSVAAGWKIDQESFMQSIPVISTLKLRGSWGKSGNDRIGNYSYAATLTSNMNYPINDAAAKGTTPSGVDNKKLKWEVTGMTNIGLDLGLLKDQFTLTFEYYKRKSDDLLMNLLTAPSLGIWSGSMPANVGSVETNGIELQLGYNDSEGDFQWSANLNLGTAKNEVISLGGLKSINAGGQFEGESITRLAPGESLFHFYGWQFDGVFATDADATAYLGGGQAGAKGGDYRVRDVAGNDANGGLTGPDGKITDADRTIIGNPYPDFTLGVNVNASYKGFDLNVFIQGTYGNDICNTNIYDLEGMPRLFNAGVNVLNRWQKQGDVTDIPRGKGASRNNQISNRYIEDGSYTRLKNITLGYTIPSKLFKDKISKLRVYISAQNIITLTNYSGLDPEIGFYQPSSTGTGFIGSGATVAGGYPAVNFNTGIDYGVYPMPKSFMGGIQITF